MTKKSTYQLKISGMTCAHCTEKVRSVLETLFETSEINLDLNTQFAIVKSNKWISPDRAKEAFAGTGYQLEDMAITDDFKLPVYGMHCENCVNKVSASLMDVDGVSNVEVSLESGYARVTGNFSLIKAVTAIENEGYSSNLLPPLIADTETVEDGEVLDTPGAKETHKSSKSQTQETPGQDLHSTFLAIDGMTCASCVSRVEKALTNVPSVTRASVNFADETAWVESSGQGNELLLAIKQAGYSARLLDEDETAVTDDVLRKRLLLSSAKSFIALISGAVLMTGHKFQLFPSLDHQGFWIGTGMFSLAIMLVSGRHFFISAWRSALQMTATMDTLIALGTGIAWLYSMVIVLIPNLVPTPYVYFEAALFIIGLVNLGKALEGNAKSKTAAAIKSLLAIQPSSAMVIRNGEEIEVDIDDLHTGDEIRVRPGESIPADGVLLEGDTSVDESMLTGEPELIVKGPGATLAAGTINQLGAFIMKAERVGANTNLAHIVEAVRQAQNSKPAIGRLADKIASWFVPLVLLVALATAFVWWLAGPEPQLPFMLVTSVSVLIIACPCALGLATPLSIMVGMGRSAAAGILIRNGDSLQLASKLTTIVFDKTGTLTQGKPVVTRVEGNEKMLQLALSLECLSEHPIADGVVRYCEGWGVQALTVSNFEISPGGGVKGYIDNKLAMVGNRGFVESSGIKVEIEAGDSSTTDIYVVHDSRTLGLISLEDEIREGAYSVIETLRSLGIQTVMLTGDNGKTAKKVSDALNMDAYYAGVQPLHKGDIINSIRKKGAIVGMVGDGINDSIALTAADVGFAMSGGSDIAIESSDVTLIGNRLSSVVDAIKLSKKTMGNIYQNLFAAFIYNILLIPVAAGVLYPLMNLMISPTFAGAAMAMSSITVVLNASRLRFSKI